MADPVYLLMVCGGAGVSWYTTKAYSTKGAAIRAAEALMDKHTDRRYKENPSKTGWSPWTKNKKKTKPPRFFPGIFIETWAANSVGGINGNPWSAVAVARLNVEDDVLERLSEVTIDE